MWTEVWGGYCLSGLWRISLPCSVDSVGLPVGIPSVCSLLRFLSPSLLPSSKADSGCGVPSYTSDPLWGPLMHLWPYVGPPRVPLAFHGAPLCTFGFLGAPSYTTGLLWGPFMHLWPFWGRMGRIGHLGPTGGSSHWRFFTLITPAGPLCHEITCSFIGYLWSGKYPDHTCWSELQFYVK